MGKYVVRKTVSFHTDYLIEAENEKEAKNKVELCGLGHDFRKEKHDDVYRVLTPDFEAEV